MQHLNNNIYILYHYPRRVQLFTCQPAIQARVFVLLVDYLRSLLYVGYCFMGFVLARFQGLIISNQKKLFIT